MENTSGMIIREAKLRDLPDMAALLDDLFSIEDDFSPDRDKQSKGLTQLIGDDAKGMVLVAETGEKVVGMCTCQFLISTAEGGPVGLVEDMVVEKEFRRMGIGRQLLQALQARAGKRGLKRLQLLADVNNIPALEFYEKAGWERTRLIALRKKEMEG